MSHKGFWRFTYTLHFPISFSYKTWSCPTENFYTRCSQGQRLPTWDEIPHSRILAWHRTVRSSEETPRTKRRWMGCFHWPNSSHHNDALKVHWTGTQGCPPCLQSTACVVSRTTLLTLPQIQCHLMQPRKLPICCLSPHKQWSVLHVLFHTVTTVRNTEALPELSPLGFTFSGFFQLYLPFPYCSTSRKKKNTSHNVPFS